MKELKLSLEKLVKVKRSKHHPLIHAIHKKYLISRRTLFYVKEYGPHTNVVKTIVKESIKILLLASLISSLGGSSLEHIKTVFLSIVPLVILLPTLNDMIGDYGTIVSSRFSTMLHEGKVKSKWWLNEELKTLLVQLLIIAVITTLFSTLASLLISKTSSYVLTLDTSLKILIISLMDVILLVSILFIIAIFAGLYFFKKKEDPNNLLIPITTSVADFGNLIILSVLVRLIF